MVSVDTVARKIDIVGNCIAEEKACFSLLISILFLNFLFKSKFLKKIPSENSEWSQTAFLYDTCNFFNANLRKKFLSSFIKVIPGQKNSKISKGQIKFK